MRVTLRRCARPPSRTDRAAAQPQSQEVESARQGRALLLCDRAPVRLQQGSLSRLPEEPASIAGDVRIGKPVQRSEVPDADGYMKMSER